MQEDQTPLNFAARVLETLPAVLRRFAGLAARAGDTTTALAAAFVAFQEKVRIGTLKPDFARATSSPISKKK